MNKNILFHDEFMNIQERINHEILRRGTFNYNDSLTIPKVGEDRSLATTFPTKENEVSMEIDENTYTINTPSIGSIERTMNILRPARGDNPGGELSFTDFADDKSSRKFDFDEMRNFLVGLSKIHDIDLYYGRDEVAGTIFRDPNGIEKVLIDAENSKRNAYLKDSDVDKLDKNGNPYPIEDGNYVMTSGETNGEELLKYDGLNPRNFYDDYGASSGDTDYHPINPHVSDSVQRSWRDEGENRDEFTYRREGNISSSIYGPNPRNPNQGTSYRSRPVMGGKITSCQTACTGLCYRTCDSECSEGCSTTCWNRCGESCTSNCGNYCTGCSSMCYNSCKTKCENKTGYSCVRAGAKVVKIWSTGGSFGEPAANHISSETHSCTGCDNSCQYYPNKKTGCWDSACLGQCFTSCKNYCAASCFGGCIDNANENDGNKYKSNKIGRGCMSNCTVNCVGICKGTCEGICIKTCYHSCEESCRDNCTWKCFTNCGAGCANACKNGCGGCSSCEGSCEGLNRQRGCIGCGTQGGCVAICKNACDTNCIGFGCRAVCGMGSAGACEANCRMNCTSANCTSKCENACSGRCSTCVNGCNMQCGMCTSKCSTSCGHACNIKCTQECENNCSLNCSMSCNEICGGCSNLCYSCVNKCIAVCSQKCENSCSLCTHLCSSWCDSRCGVQCMTNCDNVCIRSCSGSCITFATGRTEEQSNFNIIKGPIEEILKPSNIIIRITLIDEGDKKLIVQHPLTEAIPGDSFKHYAIMSTTLIGGIFNIDHTTGNVSINPEMIPAIVNQNIPNSDGEPTIWIIVLYHQPELSFDDENIEVKIPFGFSLFTPFIHDEKGNIIILIEKDKFILPGEDGYEGGMEGWLPYEQ